MLEARIGKVSSKNLMMSVETQSEALGLQGILRRFFAED
jgi:hypothetical protein